MPIIGAELAGAQAGTRTADLLVNACTSTSATDVLGSTPTTSLAYERISGIPFSPFLRTSFDRVRDIRGLAEPIVISAASDNSSDLTLNTAEAIADLFRDVVLEAEINDPILDETTYVRLDRDLPQAASLLVLKRYQLDHSTSRHPEAPTSISDSWIRYVTLLEGTDGPTYKALLTDLAQSVREAEQEIDSHPIGSGMDGEYSVFWQRSMLTHAIAASLARHCPDVVISKLKSPTETPRS